ncbi:LysR family transcriptional regulator [Propionivibrio limicola]|uniref:LysR family transcriptional regulator n=1 Tax=Propionivibrio limicola TaxID=167645 RepID=UPI001292778D|nr:LysR family transcriptional regulator [Propionivibrio limicola]
MSRENFNDLHVFLAVARERSFTRAAAQLGVSPSALSQTIRSFEARLGVRLLARTTRSVSPTEAGERLLQTVSPRFDEIETELAAIAEFREKPVGTIRITCTDYAANTVLLPKLPEFLAAYPEVKVEVVVDYGLSDIIADRYDVGIRQGDEVAEGMIAVRVGPDMRFVIVGAPSYLAKHPSPKKPQDLSDHNCINLRLPTHGGLYAWELKKGKREIKARVPGQLVLNGTYQMLNAAIGGGGLAFVPEDLAQAHVAEGRLCRVLEDWCPTFPGLHLYYPSRRQSSLAMTLLIEALRYKT